MSGTKLTALYNFSDDFGDSLNYSMGMFFETH